MRRSSIFLIVISFLLSGCTINVLTYVRNLSEESVELTFVFPAEAAPMLKDSMYIPYSSTVHLIRKNTYTYMTDSLVAKKITLNKMKVVLPSGGMIMFDKVTSKKIGYHDPEKMEVHRPSKGITETVYITSTSGNEKSFKSKGKMPKLYWFDIY